MSIKRVAMMVSAPPTARDPQERAIFNVDGGTKIVYAALAVRPP